MEHNQLIPPTTLEPKAIVTIIVNSAFNLIVEELNGNTSVHKLGKKIHAIVSEIEGVRLHSSWGGWGVGQGSLFAIVNKRDAQGGYVKDIEYVLASKLLLHGFTVTPNKDTSRVYLENFIKEGYNLTLLHENGIVYLFDRQSLSTHQEMITIPVSILDEMTTTLARYSKILAGYKAEQTKLVKDV